MQREELLNQEEDSKKRLEEANRIIREQAALSQSQQQLQSQSTSTLGTKRPATELAEQPGLHQSHLSHHSQRPEPHVASDFKKIRTEESLPGKEFKSAVHSSDAPMPPPPPILPNSPPKQVKATPPMTEQEFLSTQTQDQVSTTSFSAQDEPHMADAGTSDQSAEPKRPVTISGPVTLHIQVPGAGPDDHMFLQWNFKGQIIALSIDDAESTSIKSIKDQLSRMLGNMPLNKMQLKNDHIGFLKDNYKLSDSVGSTVENIDLVPKVRGGRK